MVKNIKKEPLGNGFYVNVSEHHKFGTDAILLANFSAAKPKDRAVDIGTGCGIIPLLWLRDGKTDKVVGIDISDEAFEVLSITKSRQKLDKLTVIKSDIKEIKGKIDFGSYTLITCNPPYKSVDAGIKSLNEKDRISRHETACTLEDVVSTGARLLQTSGRMCLCIRPERTAELVCLMHKYKLEPKRMRLAAQSIGKEPWLILIEGRKCGNSGMRIEPTLYIEQDGVISKEMVDIYGSYKEAYL